jgi:poly(A) polymerase
MIDLVTRSARLGIVRDALRGHDPWLVGGSVRDLLMERPLEDVDLVLPGDAEAAARELARASGGPVFPLSERFGAWRVIARDRGWQADLTPIRGDTIEADLALRDFTVNAMALPLSEPAALVDPHAGRADLEARALRVVGERSYSEDPLRTLRMARLACELGFSVDERTRQLAAQSAGGIGSASPERVFYELRRLIASDDVIRGLELMDEAGLVEHVLPELQALKGIEQNPYHHLDVWGHTLAVLEELLAIERDLPAVFGEASTGIRAELDRALADDLTRGQALRLGALLHDAGKPATRRVMDTRVLFIGHDDVGAEMARETCRRLRASSDLADYVAALTRHHLRLGFLVHERPLSRRHVYRYLRACEPVELEVTVLSAADRLATRGERTREEAIHGHLEVARELAVQALAWRGDDGPRAPVNGDELMQALRLDPGPRVGELLELLREAAFAGEIGSRDEALALALASLGD